MDLRGSDGRDVEGDEIEQSKSGLAVKAPKTAKGRRTIPLPSLTVAALRTHKAEQGREKLRLGPAYDDQGLVCARPDGTVWKPDSLSAAFQWFVRNHKLTRIRFHDLRHTHATQLLLGGAPKVVAERLGHSTIVVTLDTYSHVVAGLQEAAARQLDRALRKALKKTAGS